jgi:ATP-binding cassette subfamily B protein
MMEGYMSILNTLPAIIRTQLSGEPIFSAKTDLQLSGQFGEQWVVVAEREISLWQDDGTQSFTLAIRELKEARAVNGVGGGTLLADTRNGPVVIARYTAALSSVFGFAAKLLTAIAKQEERPVASEKEFPRYCPN